MLRREIACVFVSVLLAACGVAGCADERDEEGTPAASSTPAGTTTDTDTPEEPTEEAEENSTTIAREGEATEPVGSTTEEETPTEDATVRLSLALDLVGPVAFADRFGASLTVDGVDYATGFCGYGDASTRCSSTELYTWDFETLRRGATVSWSFTRTAPSTTTIAQAQNETLSDDRTIAVKCTYRDADSDPVCVRTS
jgi:hypothetical protein